MRDTNALGDALMTARRLWLHKKMHIKVGPKTLVDIDHTIPGLVHDTIDALWSRDLKPLIIKQHKKKTESGWDFVIHLPPGISYRDFVSKHEYFHDSTGGAVEIKKHGKAAIVTVLTESLRSSYPYTWGPDYFREEMYLPFPVGHSAAGFITGDLSEYPNLLIAGHPGAGKSNMLHVILVSLLLCRNILPVVIDRKKVEFEYLRPWVMLAEEMAEARMALDALNREIDRRAKILKGAGVEKLQEMRNRPPFIVLVIDELAELNDQHCQDALNRIVRLGRAPGVCTIAATQRPSSTMFQKFGDSKAMFASTICFNVRDGVNSRMVLDNDRAALIPKIPGRAIYQFDRELEVQAPYLPIKKAKKLLRKANVPMHQGGVRVEQPVKRLPARQGDNQGGGAPYLP